MLPALARLCRWWAAQSTSGEADADQRQGGTCQAIATECWAAIAQPRPWFKVQASGLVGTCTNWWRHSASAGFSRSAQQDMKPRRKTEGLRSTGRDRPGKGRRHLPRSYRLKRHRPCRGSLQQNFWPRLHSRSHSIRQSYILTPAACRPRAACGSLTSQRRKQRPRLRSACGLTHGL